MEDSHIFFRHRDLGKMSGALTTTLRKVRQPLPGNEQRRPRRTYLERKLYEMLCTTSSNGNENLSLRRFIAYTINTACVRSRNFREVAKQRGQI